VQQVVGKVYKLTAEYRVLPFQVDFREVFIGLEARSLGSRFRNCLGVWHCGTPIAIIHVHFQVIGLTRTSKKHTMNAILATVNVPDTASTLALLAIAVSMLLVARFRVAR
jgi:hypothetical protein